MRSALVGNTGFVGSNLAATLEFDACVNSRNVKELYGSNPEVLIYAGVRGTKFIANSNPDEDWKNIEAAERNIKNINPKRLLLISTVDVYDDLNEKDESHVINPQKLHCYGKNRYMLEEWARGNVDNCQILRLPAIFGMNLKKNFIHDLIDPIPKYLTKERLEEICKSKNISAYYELKKGLYELKCADMELYEFFEDSPYCAIYFTDSRAEYQYLDLRLLYKIVGTVLDSDIEVLNCVTEPVISSELYFEIYGKKFENGMCGNPIRYHLRTRENIGLFGGAKGWLMNRDKELELLKDYIRQESDELKKQLLEKGV